MLYNTERPNTFDKVVGQKHVVKSIRNQAIQDKWFNVYLFIGQFGGGKTTMARIISLAANCEHHDENGNPCLQCASCKAILNGTAPDIVEIDAASNNGVDNVRSLIDAVTYVPLELKYKVYIIDEVHMLSKGAFNALLKVLEEPPKHVIFVLCTTEANSIPATIKSRSACYTFEQITHDEIVGKLSEIAKEQSILAEKDALTLIARYSQGALRNALSIFEQAESMNEKITVEKVQSLLGVTSNEMVVQFCAAVIKAETVECIKLIDILNSQGRDFYLLCNDIIEIITDTLIYKIGSINEVKNTEQYKKDIVMLGQLSTAEQLCTLADEFHKLRDSLRHIPGKTTVIVSVIRLTTDISSSFNALASRIKELELQIKKIGNNISQRRLCEESPAEIKNSDSSSRVNLSSTSDDIKDCKDDANQYANNHSENCVANDTSELIAACSEKETEIKNENSEPKTEESLTENESLKDIEAEKEESETIISDSSSEMENCEDEFDFYDLLCEMNVFGEKSETNELQERSIEKDKVANCELSEEVKYCLELIEKISKEDEPVRIALNGCEISTNQESIEIKTFLPPIQKILSAYFESYNARGYNMSCVRISMQA